MTVGISRRTASSERPRSHVLLGVHKSLWPHGLGGLSGRGAKFRLPTHTALRPRVRGAFLRLQLAFPVACGQQPIWFPRSARSLLSPGLRPHTFAPTPTSTRQELGRDVGHQCRRPAVLPAGSGPCASLAQLVAGLMRWRRSPLSTKEQRTWKCAVIPHQPL